MIDFANDNVSHRAATAGVEDDAARCVPNASGSGFGAERAEVAALERLGDDIAELAAHLHAATYRLLVMLADFDRRGGWGGGFRSCAHWLSWRTRLNLGAAREKVRVARALEHLPQLSDALRRGELSYAVARALTRIATPENESELLQLACNGTASHVERVVRAWRRVDRLEEQFAERERHRSRHLHLYPDDDGMYVLRGRLSPEVGALLERALAAATEELYERTNPGQSANAETTSYTQREADAIGLLAEWALVSGAEVAVERQVPEPEPVQQRKDAAQQAEQAVLENADVAQHTTFDDSAAREYPAIERDAPVAKPNAVSRPASAGRAERFQVVVHVDAEALRESSESGQAVLTGGVRVSAETCRRIACDCSRVVMVHDGAGNVLDVGRRTRAVPAPIRRALEHRDGGCRFPGCNRRICDAHHIEHWADGGTTKLANLALLCRAHHRVVHEDGFGMHVSPKGEISFTRPDGRPLLDVPAPPHLRDDCVDQLVATNHELGLEIGPWTATPPWTGERLDLDYAIRGLRAL